MIGPLSYVLSAYHQNNAARAAARDAMTHRRYVDYYSRLRDVPDAPTSSVKEFEGCVSCDGCGAPHQSSACPYCGRTR